MNAVDLARHAYKGPSQPLRTPRDSEYDIFARVTHRLRAAGALARTMSNTDVTSLPQAIHDNRRLWTALAADTGSEGNGLPAPLRAQIVYLAEFTRQHSSKVLEGSATIEALIDINTAVMRGLRREGGTP